MIFTAVSSCCQVSPNAPEPRRVTGAPRVAATSASVYCGFCTDFHLCYADGRARRQGFPGRRYRAGIPGPHGGRSAPGVGGWGVGWGGGGGGGGGCLWFLGWWVW